MKDYPLGASIIDSIDFCFDKFRHWLKRYRAREFQAPFRTCVGKIEKYFILAGGLALIIGLTINTAWWPWRVRVIYHDPIVNVDWAKFISNLSSQDPNGEWAGALSNFGILTSTQTLGWVTYRLQWYADADKSIEYWNARRAEKGIRVTPGMIENEMAMERLNAAEQIYGYRDPDISREYISEFYNPMEPARFLQNLTKSPSWAIPFLAPPPTGNRTSGQDFLVDIFHMAGATIKDKMQRARFYEALRSASTFFTPFEIQNNGHASAANLRIAVSVSDQEIVQQFLDRESISKSEKVGMLQLLNAAVLGPGEAYAILLKSSSRPLPANGFFLQERPIVTQVADYWPWILLLPLIVFLF